MRRTAAAALLLVPALLLTGCGSSAKKSTSTASGSASASAAPVPTPVDAASPMPTVGGTFGKSATVTLPSGSPSGQFVVHTVSDGNGPAVSKTDVAISNLVIKDWTTGKTLEDSYSKSGAPLVLPLAQGNSIAALQKGIVGHKEGSRVLVVAPPAAAAAQMNNASNLGIGAGDTLVFVIDITQRIPVDGQASGTPQSAPADLPKVDASAKKAATITIPKGAAAPTSLKSAVLVKGSGPKVASGQTIVVQYTGALWPSAKVFDSSWNDAGAFSTQIGVGSVIKGWDQGLVGQTVGSRVLLVVPPSLGYGSQASNSIPANSTLVFVVDILGAA